MSPARPTLKRPLEDSDSDSSKDPAPAKVHNCQYCRRGFTRNADLKRHRRIHEVSREDKKYHCTLEPTPCPASKFATDSKATYDVHMNKHYGRRPHRCLECKQRFTDPSSLIRHRKTEHGYIPRGRKSYPPSFKVNPSPASPASSADSDSFASSSSEFTFRVSRQTIQNVESSPSASTSTSAPASSSSGFTFTFPLSTDVPCLSFDSSESESSGVSTPPSFPYFDAPVFNFDTNLTTDLDQTPFSQLPPPTNANNNVDLDFINASPLDGPQWSSWFAEFIKPQNVNNQANADAAGYTHPPCPDTTPLVNTYTEQANAEAFSVGSDPSGIPTTYFSQPQPQPLEQQPQSQTQYIPPLPSLHDQTQAFDDPSLYWDPSWTHILSLLPDPLAASQTVPPVPTAPLTEVPATATSNTTIVPEVSNNNTTYDYDLNNYMNNYFASNANSFGATTSTSTYPDNHNYDYTQSSNVNQPIAFAPYTDDTIASAGAPVVSQPYTQINGVNQAIATPYVAPAPVPATATAFSQPPYLAPPQPTYFSPAADPFPPPNPKATPPAPAILTLLTRIGFIGYSDIILSLPLEQINWFDERVAEIMQMTYGQYECVQRLVGVLDGIRSGSVRPVYADGGAAC